VVLYKVRLKITSMKPFTVKEARDNLYRLIDRVAETHQPITIKGKRNDAVLLSREDWEAIAETIYLNSIPGMVESIKSAATEPLSAGTPLEELEW
jgi:antitoxin YefM